MRIRLALPLGGALLAAALMLPGIALAHDQRDVGSYHFAVGFLNEPSLVDQMNGIDLTITKAADKSPVEGADKTLKAEVIVGGNAKSMPITLAARFGMPGKYAGYFMPTATGSYTFHFFGTINGEQVDQRFESGPGRFDDVQDVSALQFPNKLPDPAAIGGDVRSAQSAANQGRILGAVGLVLGLAGLVLGGMAWSRARPAAEGSPAAGTTKRRRFSLE